MCLCTHKWVMAYVTFISMDILMLLVFFFKSFTVDNELFLKSHINYRKLTKGTWIIGWRRQTALILPPQFLWVWISAAALTHFNTLLSLSPVSSQEVSQSIFVDFFSHLLILILFERKKVRKQLSRCFSCPGGELITAPLHAPISCVCARVGKYLCAVIV